MTVKLSELVIADIILVRGLFLCAPFNWLTRFFTKDADGVSIHTSFCYYGKNEWGTPLIHECIGRSGPNTFPLSAYIKKDSFIEVYRIKHRYANVYRVAMLMTGDEANSKFGWFDWPLILFRATLAQIGFTGRISHKYYPLWWCAEYLQTQFEGAVNHIEGAIKRLGVPCEVGEVTEAYKKDILAHFPKARLLKNKTRVMFPHHWRRLSFLEKAGEGKLTED